MYYPKALQEYRVLCKIQEKLWKNAGRYLNLISDCHLYLMVIK